MQAKASSRLGEQLSETTTRKLGGNRILAMKICNFLLTKCFHGRAVLAGPSRRPTRRHAVGQAVPRGAAAAGAGPEAASKARSPCPCLFCFSTCMGYGMKRTDFAREKWESCCLGELRGAR